jgi:hypothetical protein
VKKIKGKLTFANVVSCLALFVALGGASYAAFQLPKNSVGSKQIKKGAVTAAKLSAAAKRALRGATGPQGKEGATGPQGPGAISFEAPAPETYADLRTFNGVRVRAYCEPAGGVAIALASSAGGGTLDVTGTANSYEVGEETFPIDLSGGSSVAVNGISGPHQADLDAIARDTAVSAAFGRFDLHLEAPGCVLRGMYIPSAVG